MTIFGNGEQKRAFSYIGDVAPAIARSICCRRAYGEIFNVGTGRQSTLAEVVDTIINLTSAKVKINWQNVPGRSFDTDLWVADMAKVKQGLGFEPKYDLAQGLKITLDWFLNNQEIFKENYARR